MLDLVTEICANLSRGSLMHFRLAVTLVFSASTALAQADLWSHVSAQSSSRYLQSATVSDAQLKSFGNLLRKLKPDDIWQCDASEIDDVIKGLRFESIPMPDKRNVVLAEAPSGCARGGQGANGAMWVIRFDGDKPILLATPKDFNGWLFSIQPSPNHGYPDIVLGWHMSAGEAGLSYFRFDGKSYRCVGNASLLTDDQDNQKIVPTGAK
jgi:hypothetical protein